MAKLAMGISAKHRTSMIACWHYIDVPDTIWKIPKLEDVWGINVKTADHLRRLGINNMYDLAHSDPAILKKEFGVIGDQVASRIRAQHLLAGGVSLYIGYADYEADPAGFSIQEKITPTDISSDLVAKLRALSEESGGGRRSDGWE